MARLARAELVDPAEVAVFHCINRCVRRAYLCGQDPLTGQDYSHRKAWLERRLRFLAGQVGIDVLGFAILSNHFHVLLRSRPDVVAGWSDTEVATRWLALCPNRKTDTGQHAEPTAPEINMIRNMPERLAEIRDRLSNISWFMRLVAEPLARFANQEDQTSGRFWQGRFRAVKLCDEAAVLACAAYVDLNPIRAGVASTLEASDFTSVQRRIESEDLPEECATRTDGWLAPLQLDERAAASQSNGTPSTLRQRASDQGFLPLSFAEYKTLLEWTARNVRNRHAVAAGDRPRALARVGISAPAWLRLAAHFGKLFQRVAGAPESIARLKGRRRFRCRQADLLATSAAPSG